MDLTDDNPVAESGAGAGAGAGVGAAVPGSPVAAPALSKEVPALVPYHIAPLDVPLEYCVPNLSYPGLKLVHSTPPMYEIESFLSAEECDRLKALAAPGLKESIVVDGVAGKTAAPSRTSKSCFLAKTDTEWLSKKVELLTRKPAAHQEPAQVANYQRDQLYQPHFDAFDVTTGPGMECALTGGQRVMTVLVYLNDCPRGGGTYFPKLDVRFRPVKGKGVIFFPTDVYGRLDSLALHTGEAAVEEKWLGQVWIRQTDFGRRLVPTAPPAAAPATI